MRHLRPITGSVYCKPHFPVVLGQVFQGHMHRPPFSNQSTFDLPGLCNRMYRPSQSINNGLRFLHPTRKLFLIADWHPIRTADRANFGIWRPHVPECAGVASDWHGSVWSETKGS
jgi:hypothetical protein